LLLNILVVSFFSALAQGNWELKKNENGIAVYTRKPAKGNLKELRVVCELNATKAQLISVLQDIANYNDWVYSNKKAEILETPNPDKIIYYAQSRLPWPIKDRDLVIQLDINSEPEILYIRAKSLPSYLPQTDKFIRVPYSLAVWKVTQAANHKLKVDYTFSVDPGGSIPAWIVNATMATGPYNSFVKLREVLKDKANKL
ncbi:MAG: START domain-containing protein, partial [Mucilaginibacter sp.]